MSSIQTGKINSPETKAKMSESHKGKIISEETKLKMKMSYSYTDERREKFIKSASKPIICYPSEIIYDGITQAAKILGIDHSRIIKILKGRQDNYKGLTFKYI